MTTWKENKKEKKIVGIITLLMRTTTMLKIHMEICEKEEQISKVQDWYRNTTLFLEHGIFFANEDTLF
jgi:hypothetical protein